MDLEELGRVVAEVAATESAVLAAWIFGSRSRGEARRSSDLDVAILTDATRAPAIEDRVGGEIAARTGLDVDVCRLEAAGPVLALEIVAGGRRVFARDDEHADVVEERARRAYLDTQHLRRVQNHYLYGDPL
jgi:predicted nucleotidyltransferase